MSRWQVIFLQSKANRGIYIGDTLPPQNWSWPKGTWFQKRLRHHRGTGPALSQNAAENPFEHRKSTKYKQRGYLRD